MVRLSIKLFLLFILLTIVISCSVNKPYNEAIDIFNSDDPERHLKAMQLLDPIPYYFAPDKYPGLRFENPKAREIKALKRQIKEDYKVYKKNELFKLYQKSKIAYIVDNTLIISKIDGSDKTVISNGYYCDKLSWTKGTDYIVFSGSTYEKDSFDFDLFILNVHTKKVTQLTDNDYLDTDPYLSHDNKKIIFVRKKQYENQLYELSLDTMSESIIFPKDNSFTDNIVRNPIYLQDNKTIILVFGAIICQYNNDMAEPESIMKQFGKNELRPTLQTLNYKHDKIISPSSNGKNLLFEIGESFSLNIETGNKKEIRVSSDFSWSPDDKHVIYTSNKTLSIISLNEEERFYFGPVKLFPGRNPSWSGWLDE